MLALKNVSCIAGKCEFALITNLEALDKNVEPANLYNSNEVHTFMKKLAFDLNIQTSDIYPVFTYGDKKEIRDDICAILLHAFAEITQSVEDFLFWNIILYQNISLLVIVVVSLYENILSKT